MGSDSTRLLLTGCSSLTGAAFATALHQSGFAVKAGLTQPVDRYSGLQAARLMRLPGDLDVSHMGTFGSETFLEALGAMQGVDAVLFHHAYIGDHRSPAFDVENSVESSTMGLREVLRRAVALGARLVVITRSVFEAGEGGDADSTAFSRYGLAKSLIALRVKDTAHDLGLDTRDFVIPNPVGPFEKPGLPSDLAHSWLRGEAPTLSNPDAVRDFIPVDLLASAYVEAVREALSGQLSSCSPSLWPLSVANWAGKMAGQFGRRLGSTLEVQIERSPSPQPGGDRRVGRQPISLPRGWSEDVFWDSYLRYFSSGSQ